MSQWDNSTIGKLDSVVSFMFLVIEVNGTVHAC